MNMKHTPGPWAVREHWANEEAFEVYPTRNGEQPEFGQWSAIVEVGDEAYEDEAKANARLIAAAPDLLEALQATEAKLRGLAMIVEWESGDCRTEKEMEASHFWPHEVYTARAAIAKAKGGAA